MVVLDSEKKEGSPLLAALALSTLEQLQGLMHPCSGLLEVVKNILACNMYVDPETTIDSSEPYVNEEAEAKHEQHEELIRLPLLPEHVTSELMSDLSKAAYKYYRATTFAEKAEMKNEKLEQCRIEMAYAQSRIEEIKLDKEECIRHERRKGAAQLAWSRLVSRKLFGEHMRKAHGATREALERIRSLESKVQPTIENVSKLFAKFSSSSETSMDSINDTQIACIKELTYSVPNLAYEIVYELIKRKSPNSIMVPYLVKAMMQRPELDRNELIEQLLKALQERNSSPDTRKLLVNSVVGPIADPSVAAEDIHEVFENRGKFLILASNFTGEIDLPHWFSQKLKIIRHLFAL